MTNIVHEVWKIIDRDPSIKKDLSREIINMRALASYIIKEKKIKASMDAVISALRRYQVGTDTKSKFDQAAEIVGSSSLSTRSKIVNITIAKDQDVQNKLQKVFSIINYNRGDTLRIMQGEEVLKIIIDEKNLEQVLKILPGEKIIRVHTGLAEINMHLHKDAVETRGIIVVICSELLANDVNMVEIMSCVPELLILVEEKDMLRAYQTLFNLCKH